MFYRKVTITSRNEYNELKKIQIHYPYFDEGAQNVIEGKFHIELSQIVKETISGYRENNDWLTAWC